jgi:ABC-2 type transport system permease protein
VVGFAIAYILMLALSLYGGLIASGVVEEKSTRIVEIVLSTVRPTQLLAGKIIGVGLVGLCQLVVLGAAALAIFIPTGVVSVPSLSLGALLVDLLWFLLGFYFYATIFAAGAALVSRQEDIPSVTAPPVILLILSYVLVNLVMFDPNSLSSTLLSLLPPFAPVLMVARLAAGNPPLIQVVGAAALTIAATIGLTQVAGRIYANSILRMGARVGFRDALRRRPG